MAMTAYPRTMSRRQSLPYGQSMNYSYQDQGYGGGYGDQTYSPYYGDNNYSGLYPDQMMPHSMDYAQSPYPAYGHQGGVVPPGHRLPGTSYGDMSLGAGDPYYADDMQQQLAISRPVTPMQGYAAHRPRQRRHSSVSYSALPPAMIDGNYRSVNPMHIKFKRKGAFMAGVNLGDAQSTRTRLSGNDLYTLQDLHANPLTRRIHLKVRWAGYAPLVYEVPLDLYDGRIDMSVLGRRVARACIHYLQMNMVPVMHSRVELHHLEEMTYGVWQPMLSTR